MKPIIEWEYFNHLRHYANLYGNFMVDLKENKADFNNVSDNEKKRICNDVLNPLCEIADLVYLYGKFPTKELDSYPGINYLMKRGKIQIMDKSLSPYIELLDTSKYGDIRGSLLFCLTVNEDVLSSVFSKCYDPAVMSGFGSSCTKAAIRYAKSKMSGSNCYAILSEVNSGFEWLFFLANESVFLKLTELAGKNCKARQGFINCYGPKAKLEPIQEKTIYGTGFPE